MSRVGEQPISVIDGVTVSSNELEVLVKGPLGELSLTIPKKIKVLINKGEVLVTRTEESKKGKSLHGLIRSLIANMIEGVTKGYKKDLLIEGVGFRAVVQGSELLLYLGFASPKQYQIPDGIKVAVENNTRLSVTGIDKQLVGQVAASIRSYFPAEPYKGKGVRYANEIIRRKTGKTIS